MKSTGLLLKTFSPIFCSVLHASTYAHFSSVYSPLHALTVPTALNFRMKTGSWKRCDSIKTEVHRDTISFVSVFSHALPPHIVFLTQKKNIYNKCNMPQHPTKIPLAAPLSLWNRQSSASPLEFLVEPATYQPIKKTKGSIQ